MILNIISILVAEKYEQWTIMSHGIKNRIRWRGKKVSNRVCRSRSNKNRIWYERKDKKKIKKIDKENKNIYMTQKVKKKIETKHNKKIENMVY